MDPVNEKLNSPEKPCETCGRFDAILIVGVYLCENCLQERGSCCAGEFDCDEPEK